MTVFPHKETLEFEATSNVSANDEITGDDFDNIEGDPSLSSKEIFEVTRIEADPPLNADGTLDEVTRIRLHDGADYYPHVDYRWFMLGWGGSDFKFRTPKLGESVLANKVDPEQRPMLTATPKFGPEDRVDVAVQNNGAQIDQNFTVRVTGWRFKGNDAELNEYFSRASNLSTTLNQTVSMSNPFDEEGQSYPNEAISISENASGGAHGQFARLTGGVSQNIPKAWPWATWADNLNATEANTDYEMSFSSDNVDDKYQSMFFSYEDAEKATIFNYAMVNDDVANLKSLKMELESRPEEEITEFDVEDNDQHQLPFIRRLDGTVPSGSQVVKNMSGPTTVGSPTNLGTAKPVEAVDRIPRRLGSEMMPLETVVWDDEGGIVVFDDGNSISANSIIVGVQGHKLELDG